MNLLPVKIVLAEDHLIFREMIKESLRKISDLKVIGEVGDGEELLDFVKTTPPDLIILDIAMPKLQGVEAAKKIKKLYPDIKILVLTMHKSGEHLYRALSAGVDGYLLKENAYADLVEAIETIRKGKKYLSELISSQLTEIIRWRDGEGGKLARLSNREEEVLKNICRGKTNQEIADLLSIKSQTVHNHQVNIKKKLKIKTTAALIKYALEQGYA